MSFVRRCEIPSTRELGTFDELLRKSAGLAQIIVDNARAGELGKYVVTNISLLQIYMSTRVWPRETTYRTRWYFFSGGGGGGEQFSRFLR